MKMSLGAEPKKVVILVGLLVVALVVFLFNSSSDGNPGGGSQSRIICLIFHGGASGLVSAAPPRPDRSRRHQTVPRVSLSETFVPRPSRDVAKPGRTLRRLTRPCALTS